MLNRLTRPQLIILTIYALITIYYLYAKAR